MARKFRLICTILLAAASPAAGFFVQAAETNQFNELPDCAQTGSVPVPGGSAALQNEFQGNFPLQPDGTRGPCVGVVGAELYQARTRRGLNPYNPQHIQQGLTGYTYGTPPNQNQNPNQIPDPAQIVGNYQLVCQPQPGNPHVAIDPLQGNHQVNAALAGNVLTIAGPLPFGTYQGQLLVNQSTVAGVFQVDGVAGAASQAGVVFTLNGLVVSLNMNIQRGLFAVLPGGQTSDWFCGGNHL